MKKKIIAIIMSIVLCMSLVVPAFAEGEDDLMGSLDMGSILSSEIVQELLSSEGVIDLTGLLIDIVTKMNPESIQAMGQEKMNQVVASMVETISDYISLLTGNMDLVFTYDPLAITGNLFDLDTDSLTTQNPENTTEHPDEMHIGMGDVNGDGVVTAADARLILRRSAKLVKFTMEQDALADVNNDGKVTAADARIVLRVSAKLESFDA